MKINRRRMFQALAAGGASGGAAGADAAGAGISIEVLRNVSEVHGTGLTDDRLRVLRPVMERHGVRLRALRELEVPDSVLPTQEAGGDG
jgi:hypothetical protein